jgi:hypothetical protein
VSRDIFVQDISVNVEVGVREEAQLESFALHVRASDPAASDALIDGLLRQLGARAFDTDSPTGIFSA